MSSARRVLRVAGAVGAVVGAAFVVREAVRGWPALVRLVRAADPGWLALSALGFLVFERVYAFAWPYTLRRLGYDVPRIRSAALFLVTQMAKFVPGGVWHIVGRLGAFRAHGVPAREGTGALAIEAAFSAAAAVAIFGVAGTVSSAIFGSGVPGWWRAAELPASVVGAAGALWGGRVVASRFGARLGRSALGGVALLHLVVWLGYAASASAVAAALGVPAGPVAGAFALSWLAGFLAVGVPSGLGVREAVMLAALRPSAGPAGALAVTAGSRAVWTGVQLVAAAAAAIALAARRRPSVPVPS